MPARSIIKPRSLVVVADATFFKRVFGICVFRSPHLRKNLCWRKISYETIDVYRQGRLFLENQGFIIQAIVLDGRPGVREVFSDIPVQMCHYHQKAIINRYLTTRPKLQASIELRWITSALCGATERLLGQRLNCWHKKWSYFLKERTVDPETSRWFYTHRRLRAAYRSLETNLPYLFTYQRYPRLKIPNTTNSLDGSFSHLKELVKIHRGLKRKMKHKLIEEILAK